MIKSGVYKITNLVNGKVYIGSAQDIEDRWCRHKRALRGNYHENSYLQNAWNKYGEENFSFSVLEYVSDKKKLHEREQYWIDKTLCYQRDKGYNIQRFVGKGRAGVPHSEETKRKMSLMRRGVKHPMFGKHHSEETKKKLREANSGEKSAWYGKKFSKEHRMKISEAQKGENHSQAKLTDSQVKKIKLLLMSNSYSVNEISKKYNVDEKTIFNIKNNYTWKHILVDGWNEYVEKNTRKILTVDKVIQIKEMLVKGMSYKDIAEIFNVKYNTVTSIARNESWKDVYVEGWEEYIRRDIRKKYKLTEEDVIEIKKMLMAGIKHSIIAEKFQVNKCVIKEISRDKNWKNVKVEGWDEWINGKR